MLQSSNAMCFPCRKATTKTPGNSNRNGAEESFEQEQVALKLGKRQKKKKQEDGKRVRGRERCASKALCTVIDFFLSPFSALFAPREYRDDAEWDRVLAGRAVELCLGQHEIAEGTWREVLRLLGLTDSMRRTKQKKRFEKEKEMKQNERGWKEEKKARLRRSQSESLNSFCLCLATFGFWLSLSLCLSLSLSLSLSLEQ